MTVEENLRLGAINRQARPHTAEGLDKVYAQFPRLDERRRQAAGTLSGGEKQMLVLGRGLMSLPKVLLLDEPSLGLAPLMVDLIFDSIGVVAGAGMTILLSEQNAGLALELAERAFVLENGAIALTGSGADLLDDAAVRRAYLGLRSGRVPADRLNAGAKPRCTRNDRPLRLNKGIGVREACS